MKRQHILFLIIPIILFLFLAFMYKTALIERLDLAITLAMMDMRTNGWTSFFILITNIGSWTVTAPVWFILCALLLMVRKGGTALFLTIVFWGSRTLNWFLKEVFGRARPDIDQLVHAAHYSFPSGHAMNSMAFYGALLLLGTLFTRAKPALSRAIAIFLMGLILFIGASRIYLGVHYFTDILAGYSAGLALVYGLYRLFRQKLS
ncbi:phosphatase PAP2 family protein [Priestia abyssalis]|uniref:phosphatase PAP2 family protein n=1 Tax=Priestia abyssalis TaxID=1221450 RepID=UPI0009950DEA|nr:phosphatase PAP2 family protein [Priestia abyssalis]